MDKTEYQQHANRLGLTQPGMAKFLGVSRRTANSMANGGPISPTTAMLLRLMALMHLTVDDIPQ